MLSIDEIDSIVETILRLNKSYLTDIQAENSYALKFILRFFHTRPFHREFDIEFFLFLEKNMIECLNMPGVTEDGKDFWDMMYNVTRAVVECADARICNGKWFLNRVNPMQSYRICPEIESKEIIKKLKKEGWNTEYNGPYHTILLSVNSKVTFSIPNKPIVSSHIHYNLDKYQFLISAEEYRENDQYKDDN